MTATNPIITLNNGTKMPALGLGVYQSSPEETAAVVSTALQAGYRLIDTAAAYQNEKQVGEGIRNSDINRSDIFVTTKLWMFSQPSINMNICSGIKAHGLNDSLCRSEGTSTRAKSGA
jgi:diketogulonate reductase-like aldo/keto reductase